ncbi:MAG: hypothetical protein H0X39_10530 [Actinobacteria bacterium]|nr:hypothetical protein [Actinomycetota bacterium]
MVAYLVLLTLYAWQTTRIPSPWIFTDELQWSLLSRGVAATGHPQLRGHDVGFESLYSYFLAPAWWAASTGTGYTIAKYLNAAIMTAALFPAYALARLFVTHRVALLVGIGTVCVPSLALTGVLMPESLAYFWSVLALWLVARAILRPKRTTLVAAAAATLAAPLVRGQLEVLIPAALIAAGIFVVTGARARGLISKWTRADRISVAVLLLGIVIAGDVVLAHHSYEWFIGTHYWHRALTYGLWAFGALAVGLGVFPLFFALTWALGGRADTPQDRALAGLFWGAVVGFGVYTAVKASYIATTFSIRVEERNLIYLSPIAFLCSARLLAVGGARLGPALAACAGTGYLLWATPTHAYEHLYSDAFGLSILQWLNQTWYWTNAELQILLFTILAGGLLLVAVMRSGRAASGALNAIAIGLAVATLGWNLTGEISAANQARSPAQSELARIPSPPNWIDRANGQERAMFIGKALSNSEAFWTLEFWNKSIQDVWSVDASAPKPGPTVSPNFSGTDGELDPQLPLHWVVAPPEIAIVGKVVESAGGLDVYRVPRPIRMRSFVSGITADGWMQDTSTYVRFAPRHVRGTLAISISREAACGSTIPTAQFTFRVASLRITPEPDAQPVAGREQAVKRIGVPPCKANAVLHIPATAPLRVLGTATHLFQSGDGRRLAAFVSYSFAPAGQ